jgi:hypothetical protein
MAKDLYSLSVYFPPPLTAFFSFPASLVCGSPKVGYINHSCHGTGVLSARVSRRLIISSILSSFILFRSPAATRLFGCSRWNVIFHWKSDARKIHPANITHEPCTVLCHTLISITVRAAGLGSQGNMEGVSTNVHAP